MTEIDTQLDSLVRNFVTALHGLFRKQMVSAFDQVLSAPPGRPAARESQKPAVTAAQPAPAPKPAAKAGRPRKGGRRSDAEIAKTIASVTDFVAANPGSRMEHIGAGLGQTTKDLAGPVAKLLASGQIRREGQKRATKYFPGGGDAAAAKASPKGKAKAGAKSSK